MFNLSELIGIAISSAAITYIFSGLIPGQMSNDERYKLSAMVAIPSLILHEFGHKFIAILMGMSATFHANYFGLFIGIAFKTLGLPVFFIPAYVSVNTLFASRISLILVAIAGPLLNATLFLATYPIEKYVKNKNHAIILYLTRSINMWLLILNLLPIPGTDGFNAIRYLLT